jgi:nucleoside-diphosphate-sugar epimerase
VGELFKKLILMKYLVLGSDGQVGHELCIFLKDKGHEVVEFDIASDKNKDLRIQGVLEEYIKDTDFVMFLAFDVGGSRYLKKYQHTYEFIDNNVRLTLFTFETIKKYNKPFIFASSQMANMSYSPYGVCKSIGEVYSKALNGLTVKFWNVYGVEHDLEKSHVITDFILKAKEGEITMMTDGKEERQFLHAEDCSNALMILSEKYSEIDRDKNLHITSFEWSTILEIAKIIQETITCKITPSTEIDSVQLNKKNEPDPYILEFWKPKISLKEGVNKIIKSINNEII